MLSLTTCIDGGWSRWMWPLMPFSRSIEQPHSTVHMLCASSQRDMYLTFTQSMFVCIFVFVCICVWMCVCVRLCVLVCECLFTSNAQTNFLSIKASASRFQSVYLKKNNFSHSQQEQGLFLIFLAFLDRWTLSCGSSSPPVSMRSMTS